MKERWIDIGKCLAIIAVLLDHTTGLCFADMRIACFSYYSTSLFILLTGVTAYWSFSKAQAGTGNKLRKRMSGMLIPYATAVTVYYLVMFRSFSLQDYLNYLVHFNISAPHYYVLLYLQLLIVSPVFVKILHANSGKKTEHLTELLVFATVFLLSIFTSRYTDILGVYGGGGRLLGGSYLILLYVGMLYGKYFGSIKRAAGRPPAAAALALVSVAATVFMWHMACTESITWLDSAQIFGNGFNPPGITFMLYGFCMMNSILFTAKTVEAFRLADYDYIGKGLMFVGRHTLYIFLYHRLFLDYLLSPYFPMEISCVKMILYFSIMIGGAILLEYLLKYVKKYLTLCYI